MEGSVPLASNPQGGFSVLRDTFDLGVFRIDFERSLLRSVHRIDGDRSDVHLRPLQHILVFQAGSRLADVHAGLFIQNTIDAVWLYFYFSPWWDGDYVDNHSLAYIRWLVAMSTVALFLVRFVLMWLIVKLGFLRMKDDDADLNEYTPNIQDVRIEPDFSQSDIRFSKA